MHFVLLQSWYNSKKLMKFTKLLEEKQGFVYDVFQLNLQEVQLWEFYYQVQLMQQMQELTQ